MDAWAAVDWSTINDFNLCWRWKSSGILKFGKVTVTHKNDLLEVPLSTIRLVEFSDERLAVLVDLPIVVDENQGQKKWSAYLYEKRSQFFWYFNKYKGTIIRTGTRCAITGGFTTRHLAVSQGIEVSSIQEFNNVGTSLQTKCWPRERISGEKGCCAPIAAYYICPDLSTTAIETMQNDFHEELSIDGNSSVYVTDGTYRIIQVINRKLANTVLQQVFPAKDGSSPQVFSNDLFGDVHDVGKFLVELRDQNITSVVGISHFVSIDTEKLEIYDPKFVRGAILTQRNSEGFCLFLETLDLLHTVKVFTVWKLVNKVHTNVSEITPIEDVDVGEPKKKKRKGSKQTKTMWYR